MSLDRLITNRRGRDIDVKCSVYIATSVDGFVAEGDGGIEWLHKPEYALPGPSAYGYEEFMATVDALVMGRHSYEKVLSFPEWPYQQPVVVLTSQEPSILDHLHGKVSADHGDPRDIVARLAARGNRHLYIDGGVTIQRFLRAGLIDELTITRIPVLLGGGLSLFGDLGTRVQLHLLESRSFENGFVQVKYAAVYEQV